VRFGFIVCQTEIDFPFIIFQFSIFSFRASGEGNDDGLLNENEKY